jgi:uncharacterized protein YjbI with pentapeptide repeats
VPRSEGHPAPPRLPPHLDRTRANELYDELALSEERIDGDFSGQCGLHMEIVHCHIEGSRFTAAHMTGARLVDVLVTNSDFSGVDLDGATLTRVRFEDCRMSGAILSRSFLHDVGFSSCKLDGINLRMSEARKVTFDHVDLGSADFYEAKLDGTRFFDCDLTEADFSKATAYNARLHGSTLVDVKGASALSGSVIDSTQVLPLGLQVLKSIGIRIDDDRDPSTKTA